MLRKNAIILPVEKLKRPRQQNHIYNAETHFSGNLDISCKPPIEKELFKYFAYFSHII